MTFMERIDALCRERNISLRKMERDAGIGQGATTKWRQGAYLPANQSLRRLAEYFDVSIDYLVGDDAATTSGVLSAPASRDTVDYDSGIVETPKQSMVRIPVLGRIAAGTPTGAVEEVLDYEEIPIRMAKRAEHFALKVKGDSMYPRILAGDILIVRKQDTVESGDVAIVMVGSEDATVKRVLFHDAGITLQPFNSKYDPVVYSKKQVKDLPIRILGKVVENRQKY